MLKATFVIGAGAAGKTYFIENNFSEQDVRILNICDYQRRIYDEEGSDNLMPGYGRGTMYRCLLRANEELLNDVIESLKQGKNVVVEQTFFKAKRRIAYFDEIKKIPDVKIEVYVMKPGDELWRSNLRKRNKEESFDAHKRQAEEIEFPNPAEGIDAIYEVIDGDIRMRMDPPAPDILGPAREELAQEAERVRLADDACKKRQELLESMKERRFWHYCEVCGKKEFITAKEAYETGWDYPPQIGRFGLLSPRTCGECLMVDTLFWKINTGGGLPVVIEEELSPEELITWRRIKGEPESLLCSEE